MDTTRQMPVVHLVSCSAAKMQHAAEARHLYCSPWFSKVREIVDVENWYILSAKHGLVAPGQWIAPYDTRLDCLSTEAYIAWRNRLARDVCAVLPPRAKVVIWAGRRYRKHLAEQLQKAGHIVEVPLAGLGIGEQLQKLTVILEGKLAKPRECPTCQTSFLPRTMRHKYCKPRCAPGFQEVVIVTDEATNLPQTFWDAVKEHSPLLGIGLRNSQQKVVIDSRPNTS